MPSNTYILYTIASGKLGRRLYSNLNCQSRLFEWRTGDLCGDCQQLKPEDIKRLPKYSRNNNRLLHEVPTSGRTG